MADVSLLEPLHQELYSSANRIMSAYRFRAAVDARLAAGDPGFIAPDVGAVLDATMDRAKTSMATMVATLRQIDSEATDRFGAQLSLPTGSTVFEPVYRQYLELEAVPLVQELPRGVWGEMPLELYKAARFGELSAEEREWLTVLGYVNAYNAKSRGSDVGVPDAAKIARSSAARAGLTALAPFDMTPKMAVGAAAPVVIMGGIRTIHILGGLAAFLGVLGTYAVIKSIPSWVEGKKFEQGAAVRASFQASGFRYNIPIAETNMRIVEQCMAEARVTGTGIEKCADMSRRLLPYQVIPDPGPALAALAAATTTSCKFGQCMVWSGIGLTVGAIAGALVADRLGLGGRS